LDLTGSGQGPVAGCGECGDEPSGSCATELVRVIPFRIIRHVSTFVINHNFKVSPSATCVSAATVLCKEIDIFNKDKIMLVDIS
jgi:hypothetical protein